jgi:hypothetical protein
MDETTNLEGTERPVSDGGEVGSVNDEPFACPACGQMLAPTCRVCVACKQPVDPTLTQKPQASVRELKPELAQVLPPPVEPARFSWMIFLSVLAAWLFAAAVTQQLLGLEISQFVLGGVVILSSVWVFYDAQRKGVAKPLRWGIGVILLWILVFPWYLARRRTPQAPCPFIEGEAGPLARALLFALIVFFLLGIAIMLFKGPPPQ